MIGADVLLVSDQPFDPAFAERARRDGLRVAQTVTFPSMATARINGAPTNGEAPSQLGALKAVTDGYPLRGRLKVLPPDGGPEQEAEGIPAPGTVWADQALLDGLGLRLGDSVQLGSKTFRIERVITQELDRGAGFMNFAPRVMLPLSDLDATKLIGWGSRVTYRLLVAGPDAGPPPTSAGRPTRSSGATCATRAWNRLIPASRRCAPRWIVPSASCRWWRCCLR